MNQSFPSSNESKNSENYESLPYAKEVYKFSGKLVHISCLDPWKLTDHEYVGPLKKVQLFSSQRSAANFTVFPDKEGLLTK